MNTQESFNTHNAMDIITRSRQLSDSPTALGLCIFAGGFSFGMEEADFNVLGHLELTDCQLGIDTSRQRWPVYVGDVVEWTSVIAQMSVPDVVYANPPCVAYAGTGKHEGTSDSRMCFLRNCAYDTMMVLQPKVWVWELVPGVFSKDLAWLQSMSYRAGRLGYECHAFLTSSALHGGYQDRRRFHFVASRVKLDFEASYASCPIAWKGSRTLGEALESVRHARLEKTSFGRPAPVTDMDRLGVLPNDDTVYKGAFQTLFPHTAPGMHLSHVPDAILRDVYRPHAAAWSGTGRPGFAHTRGRLDRPSPNVLGGHTIVHPTEDRYLTPRECATIMGFPTDHIFSGGAKAYAEIGRGLCTHNARFVGKVIHDALRVNKSVVVQRHGPLNVVDWRNRVRTNSLAMPESDSRAWYFAKHGVQPPNGYGTRVVDATVDEE